MTQLSMRKKGWLIIGIVCLVVVFIATTFALVNPRLTTFVESEKFRAEMEKETAKGLHFPDGRRRWQLDEVHVQSGKVGIQVYEPKPEPSPSKPWYAIFLPDRVYLKRVDSEPVDVTWQFRDKPAGFFGTRLLITPHGRDFEYQAREGEFKMARIPEMRLQHTHLLITKTLLTLYNLDLQSKGTGTGTIHAEGKAGTRDDKSVDFKINLDRVPINEWLPHDWSEHVRGKMVAKIHWTGENPKFEASRGKAALHVEHGEVTRLPFLEKIAALTGEKELEHLQLNLCQLDLDWRYPKTDITNLILEDKGKFRAEGKVTIDGKELGGAIKLGVARHLLSWLPKAGEVFTRENDGYMWTTVHLSGTLRAPGQDLSPRIVDAIKESPGAALGVLFRGLGKWIRNAFDK